MAKRVIKLLGEPIQNEDDVAAAAITPGMLVTYDSAGDLIPHGSAGGFTTTAFALSREEMGDDIDTAYAIGDTVKVGVFGRGTRVNALIPSGQNISKGDYLESNGDGMLKVFAAGTRLARALEDSGAVTVTTRLRVEVV